MDAKVSWNQAMSFTGSAGTGFSVPLDADAGAGGVDSGFRPLELMLVSLGGCTAMDVISILRKKQQVVTGFDVQVQASQPDSHPHVFTKARITYLVTGRSVDEAALVRAIALSAQKYCPAQAMLSQVFPMELVYEIYETDGGLVKKGEWLP